MVRGTVKPKAGCLLLAVFILFMLANPEAAQAAIPTVSTVSHTVASNSATLTGQVTADGGAAITSYGFYYGSTTNISATAPAEIVLDNDAHVVNVGVNIAAGVNYTASLNNLSGQTAYLYFSYAINGQGVSYGEVKYFYIDSGSGANSPTVVTVDADASSYSATLYGDISYDGNHAIVEYGFEYGTDTSCSSRLLVGTNNIGEDEFDGYLGGLSANTTYYYRAYARNSSSANCYGSVRSFKTSYNDGYNGNYYYDRPAVTTRTPSLQADRVILNGNVDSRGGSRITSYGFYWGTSSDPETRVEVGTDNISSNQAFSYSLSYLNQGQTYYVKAYARNSYGTAYGSVVRFTNRGGESQAALSTRVSGIGANSATFHGTITSNYGGSVWEYGFAYGKSDGLETRVRVGSYINDYTEFVYNASGLDGGSSYRVRAYAVNSAGTSYGPNVNFTTLGGGGLAPYSADGRPVVVVSYPTPSTTVSRGAQLNIYASATGLRTILAMGLYVNGKTQIKPMGPILAYSLDTSALPAGPCTVRVTAWDGFMSGEQTVLINLQDGPINIGVLPRIEVVSPSEGASVNRGQTMEIAASSSSSTGIKAMGLYINGAKKMTANGASLNYFWDSSAQAPGKYKIKITAWDGVMAAEKTINVTVK